MYASETEYGLTLTLHSKANRDVFKDNEPCSFTNILKVPVKLDQNEHYEACLANIHAPSYQAFVLKKSDPIDNDIAFHMGMFQYDDDISDWKLLDNSNIDLWSHTLNKDITGLELDNGVSRIDFIKRFRGSFDLSRDVGVKKKLCLSVFNSFLRHKYGDDHAKTIVADCEKCKTLAASSGGGVLNDTRNGSNIGDGLPFIDFFENYDIVKKDQPPESPHRWTPVTPPPPIN